MRSVKHNKHPIIMSPNYAAKFDFYKEIGLQKLKERAEMIRANEDFSKRVSAILFEEAQEKKELESQLDLYAEETLYSGGFPDDKTKMTFKEFHKAEWKDRLYIADKIKDERYNYFAKKLLYEEAPHLLPKDLYNEIHRGIAKRILSTNDEKWNTIPKAYNELDSLRVKYEEEGDQERLAMTNDINNFLEEIEKKYQDA